MLNESSPLTFQGSITPDLIASKFWLCQVLKKLGLDNIDTIYILGSWYGNMAYMLDRCDIHSKRIVNVDINQDYLDASTQILDKLNLTAKVINLNQDVNKLNYKMLGKKGMVINTSINDIQGKRWFKNIPQGTLIVLQNRNNIVNSVESLEEFDQNFPISETLFLSQKTLKDPEVKYQRYLKIGFK